MFLLELLRSQRRGRLRPTIDECCAKASEHLVNTHRFCDLLNSVAIDQTHERNHYWGKDKADESHHTCAKRIKERTGQTSEQRRQYDCDEDGTAGRSACTRTTRKLGFFNSQRSHLLSTKDVIRAFSTQSWPVASCLKFFLVSTALSIKEIFFIACHSRGNDPYR